MTVNHEVKGSTPFESASIINHFLLKFIMMNILPNQVAEIGISYSLNGTVTKKPPIKTEDLFVVRTQDDAVEVLRMKWKDIEYVESFYIIVLNRANKVLGVRMISYGGTAGTVADPKVIFQTALKSNASCIILAHNHPSGNLKPSDEDKTLTRRLMDAGKFLDLPIHDHIILSRDSHFSFANNDLME